MGMNASWRFRMICRQSQGHMVCCLHCATVRFVRGRGYTEAAAGEFQSQAQWVQMPLSHAITLHTILHATSCCSMLQHAGACYTRIEFKKIRHQTITFKEPNKKEGSKIKKNIHYFLCWCDVLALFRSCGFWISRSSSLWSLGPLVRTSGSFVLPSFGNSGAVKNLTNPKSRSNKV